jgi:hypothetical protein
MHAGIETLFIFLAFIVISALSAWLQRRRQGEEEEPWPVEPSPDAQAPAHSSRVGPSRPPAEEAPAAASLSSWEKELKRLLEGARPSRPEPPRAPPVPPVVQPAPSRARPAPPPLVGAPSSAAIAANLKDSWAYRTAQARQAEAQVRLRDAKAKTARQMRGLAGRRAEVATGDITAARRLLSTPRVTRQAIIVSTILGTPKALQ